MQTASWVFGSLLLVFIMAVITYRLLTHNSRPIDETTQKLLGFVSAILAGLFAFFLTGAIIVNVIPENRYMAGLGAQATGGVALFLVMLWWWRSERAPITAEDKNVRAVGSVLKEVDEMYPQVKAVMRNETLPSARSFSLVAEQQGNEIVFRDPSGNVSPYMTITAKDLKKLPPYDRELLQVYEKVMTKHFQDWKKLYTNRNASQDLGKNKTTEDELRRIAKAMCSELQKIFNHLGLIGKRLEDHYGAMQSICYELQPEELKQGAGTVFNTNIQGDVERQTNINKVNGDVSF